MIFFVKKKKWIGIFASLLLTLSTVFSVIPIEVFANGTLVDARITDLKILTDSGSPATEINKFATIRLEFNYETRGTKILQSGDYFDITIPKEVDLSQATTNPLSFDLTDEKGDIVAKATITPNSATATTGGGNVRITFTDKAKGKYKVKGNIFFDAKLNKKVVQENKITNIKTEVNGDGKNTPDSIPIKVKPDGALSDKEIIGKWGKSPTVPNVAAWGVRVNRTNQNLKNVVITDKITSNNGHFLEPSSYPAVKTTEQFKLMKTTYDSSGNVQDWNGEVVDVSDKITFNADHTEFRLELGDIGTQSYFLSYKSTVENGDIVQTNGATITSGTFPTQKSDGVWKYRTAGGGAIGVLAKRLKIRKVDVDTNVGLAGAKFKVTKVDGTSFELTTGADGTIVSQQLVQGKYKVKELVAPNGYEIDPNEYTVNVYDDVGGTITVRDKLNKVSIPVTKKWVGKEGNAAKIHLYAGDTEVDSVTLNAGNNWQHTFAGLDKYKDGKEIKYTIKEDAIANYKSEITGDVASGFTVTNTNIEKVTVPVEKKWVGKSTNKVEVKLLADGTEKGSADLTAADNWKHEFKNLLKYDSADGHEIVYTIKEVKVDGYNTVISGTAKDGFTITNTITGKVSIPVTKKWVGKEGNAAKIHLYAGDTEVDSVTLNAGNNWQHTFAGLDKYKDGKEIKYTIKEDAIANYKSEITGDVASGFTVTNTNIEKVTVPVEKKWVGKSTNKVEVKLLADGTEKGSADLTAADNWKHEFKNLLKYDSADGHEIVYTIKEVKVDGYNTVISGTAKDGFTITNTITGKVSIPVTKKWVGKEGNAAKIHLYAGDTEVDSVTLNAGNNWQHTFAGLDKYKDGKEIKYTIKEDAIANYKSEITGDVASGFTVTNTNIEKVTVPVEKKWVGKSTNKVEVKLLADGTEKGSADLTAADNWKHEFKNLLKYDSADGHEIVYTIKEVKVDGYNTVISGTAKDGFTITNTITGKVSIPVTKKWVGKEGNAAKIHLYAGDTEVDSVTLNAGNNWQHTFAGLDKYKDGKEIKYTIKEDAIANYKSEITGDVASGFTVTNTCVDKPKSNIPSDKSYGKKIVKRHNPKTGDMTNIMLYCTVLLAAVLGLLVALIKKHNR